VTTKDSADVTDVDETETEKGTDESLDDATESDATDESTETDDAATETDAQAAKRDGTVRRPARAVAGRIGAIALAVALLASAGVTAWLYFGQYRADRQTNDAAANVALDAAKTGTVAMLSYSPESLDKDFANAKSHLTGDFLSYYTNFTQQVVTPAAKQKAVKTSAAVVRAAVSELHPDSAVVLVFINQNTTSKENPDGAFAASAVKVGLKKINGTWLISSFDPV
jgi:Mce-associated membrane protein